MTNIKKIAGKKVFYISSSIIAFLIIFSRRPDAVLNPQFWAEDGKVWYADAYNHGIIHSLLTPHDGYYQTISRIAADFAQIFPLAYAPLTFNLAAMLVKILIVNFILSERLKNLIPSIAGRILVAFVYLALPHSYETHVNLTNVQWHLALLSFLIIVAPSSDKIAWKVFDFAAITISALSGPFCLLLLPIVVIKWSKDRDKRTVILFVILAFGAIIQAISILTTERPSQQPLGATLGLFLKIVGGHLFIGSIFGEKNYYRIIDYNLWNYTTALFVNVIGFGFLIYAFIKSKLELRMLIVFSAILCFGSLVSPAITKEVPQWTQMWLPVAGVRYWMIPIFCFFLCLLYLAKNAEISLVKYASIALLVISLSGIYADWKYPAFKDYEFQKYAAEFENAPAGQEISIPINPGWEMRLVKR